MKKLKPLAFVNFLLCILVWCHGEDESMSAPMKITEQEALYSAIQGFVGKWWNGSDLYPDPCGWTPIQGVSCDLFDGLWYVTAINVGPVHDNSLICDENAKFSPYFFALKHLRALSFFDCLSSIPPQNWEVFAESLVSLEFRSNPGLKGIIPETFAKLNSLESLVIIDTGLNGEIPSSIGNLTSLKRLNLAGNKLTGTIPDRFGGLNHLLILDLSRNSLTGPLPSSVGELTSLLKLDLSSNQLEGEIPGKIGNLKDMTLMDLSKNKLSGELTKTLQELTSLDELVLSNNEIGGSLTNIEWRNLRGISTLDLSNMLLTGAIPESLMELKDLRYLGLNDNKLTGEISPNLANLPNLGAVYIHGNNLTGELKFAKWFYEKMGRRFSAWGNQNLCYPTGLVPPNYVPFGVKLCQQEVSKYLDKPEQQSIPLTSIGSITKVINGFLLTTVAILAINIAV